MVLESAPCMEKLLRNHLRVLMRLMTMAERCFEEVADRAVLSHVHHAHNAVPFQTMKSPQGNHTNPSSNLVVIIYLNLNG
jgi:hypothetical protein